MRSPLTGRLAPAAAIGAVVVGAVVVGAVVVALALAPAAAATPGSATRPPAHTAQHPPLTSAGLVKEHLDAMVDAARAGLAPQPGTGHPLYPGVVVLAGHRDRIVQRFALGEALRYADAEGTVLPADQRVPMRPDTVFDLASVSKLFTSIAALQQVEAGRLRLDEPVASYLPRFAQNGKRDITVRQLLTHVSGLPAWLPLWRDWPTPAARRDAVMAVQPVAAPGTSYLYSDLNMLTLGWLVEKVSGVGLDQAVAAGITRPLGMRDTCYGPCPGTPLDRVAATEYEAVPPRGMVRGQVHDENAWALGGVAGHAGVFSTADDLARLARALLAGGRLGPGRILRPSTVELLFTDFNAQFPGNAHGLGFELDQRWYMDAMSSPSTAGHTGFTGTMLILSREADSFLVMLTNRVHPSRSWSNVNPARRAVAREFALAHPVRARSGPTAWFSGVGDARTATMTLPLPAAGSTGPARLGFDLWYDTEKDADIMHVEASVEGAWVPVPLTLIDRGQLTNLPDGEVSGTDGRRWVQAQATLPAGVSAVRWRYVNDVLYQGRGVYVDGVRVVAGRRVLVDDRRPGDAHEFVLDGWSPSRV